MYLQDNLRGTVQQGTAPDYPHGLSRIHTGKPRQRSEISKRLAILKCQSDTMVRRCISKQCTDTHCARYHCF